MKKQFLLLFAIAVFGTALATNASAQTAQTLRANVKFDFQISDRIYPAGEYRIDSISAAPIPALPVPESPAINTALSSSSCDSTVCTSRLSKGLTVLVIVS